MTDKQTPITETDLHAYADGQLDAARRTEVETWLADRPETADRVRFWQAQNEALREAFAPAAELKPDDLERFAGERRPTGNWRNLAAALVVFVLGACGGYLAHDFFTGNPANTAATESAFAAEAGRAYLTYAAETRHAVEVPAAERDHLTTWLGNRLDHSFTTPDLTAEGFALIGGRLLPVNGKPGAMLLYEDGVGDRLSVIIARNNGMADTAFEWTRLGDVGTYHWIDGPIVYAISGRFGPDRLHAVTEVVYKNFGDYRRPGM